MRRAKCIGLVVFGSLVAVACGVVLTFSLIGRQITAELMFAVLGGLIVLFGASILYKLDTSKGVHPTSRSVKINERSGVALSLVGGFATGRS